MNDNVDLNISVYPKSEEVSVKGNYMYEMFNSVLYVGV